MTLSLNFKRIIVAGLSFVFLLALLVVAWVEGGKERVQPEPEPAVLGINRDCYECHQEKSPGVTHQWATSTHAEVGVGCYDCHGADEGDVDGWHHEGHDIATLVTPKDCGECHPDISAEFQSSHHAAAGQILGSLDNLLGEVVEGPAAAHSGCQQCHGSEIAFARDAAGEVVHDEDGKPVIDDATWPNSGIGRINPDGSHGNCAACHSRHRFSLEMARRPDNCGKCHLGPDHPQQEIYEESKHGIAFVTADHQGHMNYEADEWIVGETYSAAPTCATCHMSATSTMASSHDPGLRISWTLRPVVSEHTEDWEDKRQRMQDVCLNCHTQDWVRGHYAQYDRVVELYNGKFAEPSRRIMDVLLQQGLRSEAPFDDEVEWTFFFLWHHEGRRARMGASMMGPDYTQWHGMFEVAERFYMELIPQAAELGEGNEAVEAVIEEILAEEPHSWFSGLSPEEAARIREFYQRRYGQSVGVAGGEAP